MDLHRRTEQYIEDTDDDTLSDKGQFFTSPELTEELCENIPIEKEDNVLDPACGTGEILRYIESNYDNVNAEGWEISDELVDIAKDITNSSITKTNSLFYNPGKKYDVIIGNPPYFEIKQTDRIKDEYDEVLYGRVNIYTLFIYKSLKLLKDDGYLGFIVPTSMNNGRYFKELRKYIVNNCSIQYMKIKKDKNLFNDVTQSVMYIVLQKTENNHNNYIFRKDDHIIFTCSKDDLEDSFKGCKTLKELGYSVRTGDLMWNYNKDKLVDNKTDDSVPFIWSENIEDQTVKLNRKDKPQYIEYDDTQEAPAIVVNRITGGNESGYINAGLITDGMEFVAENHVNLIKPDNPQVPIEYLCEQLNSVDDVVRNITGNNHLSKTELQELIPIDPNY